MEHLEALKQRLAEQIMQAALRGEDDAALQKLLEAVRLTTRLLGVLNTLCASATQPLPINSSPTLEPQQGEYPRFRFAGQRLIMTAPSRNGSEYEQAVSREAYHKILGCLNDQAAKDEVLTSEQLKSITEKLGYPAYRISVVLRFLQKKSLLTSERKGRYRFSHGFASEVEQAWPTKGGSLENGMHHNGRSQHYPQLSEEQRTVLNKPVSDLHLSIGARTALERLGIETLGELIQYRADALLKSMHSDWTLLNEVREKLERWYGLNLRGDLPQFGEEEQAVLNKPVSDLNLSVRPRKALERLGIKTLGDLIQYSADELLNSKNFRMTSLTEVREKLERYGLKLRDDP